MTGYLPLNAALVLAALMLVVMGCQSRRVRALAREVWLAAPAGVLGIGVMVVVLAVSA